MGKSIIEIVGEIIAGQASQRTLSGEEIDKLIKQTYRSLKEIEALEVSVGKLEEIDGLIGIQPSVPDVHQSEAEQAPIEPVIDPRASIRDDSIICVICGREFRQLTHTHLEAHGISPDEYRRRYGIPMNQPLSARSVSDRRKAAAREKNVGEFLKQKRAAARGGELFQPTEAAPEKEEG